MNSYWVISKIIRKFSPYKAISVFAIVLFSFSSTNLKAQIAQPTSDNNPSCLNSSVTFSATVSGTSTDGIVTFYDNAVIIGTGTITAGVATFVTNTLTVGSHPITASYIDAGTGLTTSISLTQVVNPVPVVTALPATQTICSGNLITTINFNSSIGGTAFNWVRDNTTNLDGIDPAGPGGTTSIPGALINLTTTVQTTTFTIIGAANGCFSAPVMASVTVNPPPTIAAIGGPTSVCAGSTITLTEATGGGVWTSSNPGVATIDAAGLVTGITSGSTVITYTVTDVNGCVGSITTSVSVNPSPTVTASATPAAVCAGTPSSLLATSPGSVPTTLCFTNSTRGGFRLGGGDLVRNVTVAGVPAGATITSITLLVNASHQRDNEVEMYLIAPGGAALGGPGGGYQHTITPGQSIILEPGIPIPGQVPNFINTLFSDLGAGTLGPTGVAPYTGTFKPVNLFSSIYSTWPNSSSANGVWSFHILDHINSGFTGVFNNYTLCITYTTSNVTYSWTSNPAGFTSTLAEPFSYACSNHRLYSRSNCSEWM